VHHQLRQGQGFKGLIQVLPAVEGSRAADGGVETVQVDIVGLECFQVMTRKELLRLRAPSRACQGSLQVSCPARSSAFAGRWEVSASITVVQ
jgi:hypothetical protein